MKIKIIIKKLEIQQITMKESNLISKKIVKMEENGEIRKGKRSAH